LQFANQYNQFHQNLVEIYDLVNCRVTLFNSAGEFILKVLDYFYALMVSIMQYEIIVLNLLSSLRDYMLSTLVP